MKGKVEESFYSQKMQCRRGETKSTGHDHDYFINNRTGSTYGRTCNTSQTEPNYYIHTNKRGLYQ